MHVVLTQHMVFHTNQVLINCEPQAPTLSLGQVTSPHCELAKIPILQQRQHMMHDISQCNANNTIINTTSL